MKKDSGIIRHVDFGYAFAPPHRLTVGRPSKSERTLLDLQPGSLRMAWTYGNLTQLPLAAWVTPNLTGPTWDLRVIPQIDGQPFTESRWTRLDAWLPALDNRYDDPRGSVRLEVVGAETATVVRAQITNTDRLSHQFILRCDSIGNGGLNMGWVDQGRWSTDNLLTWQRERADRVMALGIGADAWSLETDGRALAFGTLLFVWNLKPGEKRVGWIVRPYQAYEVDLPSLRKHDWNREMDAAKKEWYLLIVETSRVNIPDTEVANALRACLADLFIMREPVAKGYTAILCGTEVYRATNPCEPSIAAICLDQFGLHREALESHRIHLEMQGADGEWADPQGWCTTFWGASGFKSWAVMEHYCLTGDREYLAQVYPRMAASSRWQERQRTRTRVLVDGQRSLTYGLMPRGNGDAGLMDDRDPFGVFIPHNIWAVYADFLSVKAAEILGRAEDLDELRRIYETAHTDLLLAMEHGAIIEDGYRWIPGVPGKSCGSRWGALNAAFPCCILPPDHELITGTIRKIESRISPGGIPIHTGWMEDGMWVAITLDNLAETLLMRDEGDAAADYLYATLNHGTPLCTWCEERGQESGAQKTSGDRQHIWTPVAVIRFLRDAMIMEDGDTLHLARGAARQWLGSGCAVGVQTMPTHFGCISYEMCYDKKTGTVKGTVELPSSSAPRVVLHVRLPNGLKLSSLSASSGGSLSGDGAMIEWKNLTGPILFEAVTRDCRE
ncbi:MAG: hypothetical protein NT011_12475 [Kiritimatiellaeota bacterium]|nr:hypothetical protein [Kiritimatiellota bacterium]